MTTVELISIDQIVGNKLMRMEWNSYIHVIAQVPLNAPDTR